MYENILQYMVCMYQCYYYSQILKAAKDCDECGEPTLKDLFKPVNGTETDINASRNISVSNEKLLGGDSVELDKSVSDGSGEYNRDYVEYLHVDFFSATFVSLMKKNKEKYKLSDEAQSEYYFESLILITIQWFLCIGVLLFTNKLESIPGAF